MSSPENSSYHAGRIADLPMQMPADPHSPQEARARYFNTGNAFDLRLADVPDNTFIDEPQRALADGAPSGLTPCDLSAELGCPFPATTPLILAQYARIRPAEHLRTDFAASGVIAYVIRGKGGARCQNAELQFAEGDIMLFPGGLPQDFYAEDDCVLWIVTNEPQLAFESLSPPLPGSAPTETVHFPAREIRRQIDLIDEVGRDAAAAGSAVIFSSAEQEHRRNILPTLTLAMNTLPPGGAQRAHRHNAVAVSLIIQGKDCYSLIDGRTKPWAPWATTITPPASAHSHHNPGTDQALFLIVQDGGLYYHARTMGFSFAD